MVPGHVQVTERLVETAETGHVLDVAPERFAELVGATLDLFGAGETVLGRVGGVAVTGVAQ